MQQDKAQFHELTWKEARNEILPLNKTLGEIIDELSPSSDYSFLKITYPFGSHVLHRGVLMLPYGPNQTLVPITDDMVPNKIKEKFAYNLTSNPVGMVLKKTFEIFLPLVDRTVVVSNLIKPGAIIGLLRALNPGDSHQPKFLWDMTAGARSIFMLPKISEARKHMKLKKQFELSLEKPIDLMSHWEIFRALSKCKNFGDPWNAEILFFSKNWFQHDEDHDWIKFYHYLYKSVWKGMEAWRNQRLWDLIFSLTLNNYPAQPSAYVCDTVKWLTQIAIGIQPGFAPAMNDLPAPISELQKIYKEVYQLRQYAPIIMCPTQFHLNKSASLPVYYTLQFPTTMEFGKSKRARKSLISDLHEIRNLLCRYQNEILSNMYETKGTPLHQMFDIVKFDYFHNNVELHSGMLSSSKVAISDNRFLQSLDGEFYKSFPEMSTFFKGCIRISKS